MWFHKELCIPVFCIINTAIVATGRERYFSDNSMPSYTQNFLIQEIWSKSLELRNLSLWVWGCIPSREVNTNASEQTQETTWFPVKQRGWKNLLTPHGIALRPRLERWGFKSSLFRCHSFLSQDLATTSQTLTRVRHMFRWITRSKRVTVIPQTAHRRAL